MDGTVLIADDDQSIRKVLSQAMTRAGCKTHTTSSLTTLLRWVEEGRGDVVITDVVMPDGDGIEMIPRISALRPDLPVIVISAQNSIMTAVKAAQVEAFDYLAKPFDLKELLSRVQAALSIAPQSRRIEPDMSEDQPIPLIGQSAPMQALYRLIGRVMKSDLPVLIMGEAGVGKSLVAKTLHDLGADNATAPVIITAETPGPLADDAATRTLAKNATWIIKDLPRLTTAQQQRLRQVLDRHGESAPRIISTTRLDATAQTGWEGFDQDLLYLLSPIRIKVPALRDRVGDIPLLVNHFLGNIDATAPAFDPDAMERLKQYHWPGNLRELKSMVRGLSVGTITGIIKPEDLTPYLNAVPGGHNTPLAEANAPLATIFGRHLQRYFDQHGDALPPGGLYQRILHEMERPLLEQSLDAVGGNQAKAAALLGINRNTLRKKLTTLDIRVTRHRKLM